MSYHRVKAHDSGANGLHFNNGFSLLVGKDLVQPKSILRHATALAAFPTRWCTDLKVLMAYHVVKAHDSGANGLHFNNGFSLRVGKDLVQLKSILLHATALAVLISSW